MIVDLNLNPRPFSAIVNGTKTIEVRAGKPQSAITVDDTIRFTNIENKNVVLCRVLNVTKYSTVRDLLEKCGVDKTLSSGKNLEDGIVSIESIPGYTERIQQYGVYAIEVAILVE